MSADFWAGYVSGAASIIIGNPLDLVKTRLQAGNAPPDIDSTSTTAPPNSTTSRGQFDRASTLVRGATVPILTYGALNALLFVTYNRTLTLLSSSSSTTPLPTPDPSYAKIWLAGATGGLASFVVSAPTELIKCRAQVSTAQNVTSWSVARDTWRREGIRGLYYGGGITSVRDAVGYGFYFWSYEWSKKNLSSPDDTDSQAAMKVLLCGGLAGIVTWASIFPLDVIKTRVQTQVLHADPSSSSPSSSSSPRGGGERGALLGSEVQRRRRLGSLEIATQAYRNEGVGVFFRGLGVCSVRAFVVNAVQWAVYEWMMRYLQRP